MQYRQVSPWDTGQGEGESVDLEEQMEAIQLPEKTGGTFF